MGIGFIFLYWRSTPDFITPIEQQFPVHFDVNKVKACYTPPGPKLLLVKYEGTF
jgi:hypothetical protein